jgi:hypothetical protein
MNVLVALVPAVVLAVGNYFVANHLLAGAPATCVACLAWLVGGPLVLGVLLLALLGRRAEKPVAVAAAPPPPVETPTDGALRLLAILQEGRLVDFLEEDIAPYGDEQVGAAVRGIHETCRRALHERVTLEPILGGEEGSEVTVGNDFDPAAIRLVGNVAGAPPFRGVLRHAGWRVKTVTLPVRRGHDPQVIAPAEVEIP